MKQTLHIVISRIFVVSAVRALTPVLAPRSSEYFFCQITEKRTALYDLTSFCCQCSALRAQSSFGAKKICKNDGSASDFRENPYFIEEARRFFSQSHHDPQDSRLKIFPGLGFGGLPTFFARANFNRYRNEVKIQFLCFQRFHEIFPELSSDLRRNFGEGLVLCKYY